MANSEGLAAPLSTQVKQILALFTKFVLGVAGAPFDEICRSGESEKEPKLAPEEAAGSILAACIFISISGAFHLGQLDAAGMDKVKEAFTQSAIICFLATLFPWHLLLKATKTEVVCMVIIYWIPWFVLSQVIYRQAPTLAPFLYFVPVLTAITGMWGRRLPDKKGPLIWLMPVVSLLICVVGILAYGML